MGEYESVMREANYWYRQYQYYKKCAKGHIRLAKIAKKLGYVQNFEYRMDNYYWCLSEATRCYKRARGYKPNGRCKFDR